MNQVRPGRPGKGLGHVDGLKGSEHSKARLRMILGTISGEITVREAARQLGLSESRFGEIRAAALQAAVQGLEPRPVGRPRRTPPPPRAEEERLRGELDEVRCEVLVQQLRIEMQAVAEEGCRPPDAPSEDAPRPVPAKEAGKRGRLTAR